jgi:thiol-disulfide isomerase/thioredoxin
MRAWRDSTLLRRAATALLLTGLLLGGFARTDAAENDGATLYYFWGQGCPTCEEAKPFLAELEKRYPRLSVRRYDIMAGRENLQLWIETSERFGAPATGVPAFFVGDRAFSGFSPEIAARIEAAVEETLALSQREAEGPPEGAAEKGVAVRVPLLGEIDPASLSLPLFTVVIAGLDSFNPCAFFVLLFLLSLLIHARSRRRMLLIGATFVLCSGGIYFLFMAAWLNLFLLLGNLSVITTAAGAVALVIGGINAKAFFFFHEGVSLSIPEEAKPKLFARMRSLLKAESTLTMLTGALVLAVAANSYELLCTAGFPMVFTRVLTLQELPAGRYYLYLALYNVVYVVPLAAIVGVFTVTLGSRKLSQWQGRVLKLVSGVMMMLLGGVLLIEPALLNNPLAAAGLLGIAVLVTGVVAAVAKRGWFRSGGSL